MEGYTAPCNARTSAAASTAITGAAVSSIKCAITSRREGGGWMARTHAAAAALLLLRCTTSASAVRCSSSWRIVASDAG